MSPSNFSSSALSQSGRLGLENLAHWLLDGGKGAAASGGHRPNAGRPKGQNAAGLAMNVCSGRRLRLEARPAYLPTCDVRSRDLQQLLYVDSGRPRRKDAVMV